jgi:MerR family transcriptional regulator, copper efflux regulator
VRFKVKYFREEIAMKIGELAEKTGLKPHTIRFYEKEGLLDTRYVQRGENNYRDYGEDAAQRLMLIKQAQLAGFTIAELKELAAAYDAGSLTAQQNMAYLQRKIDDIGRKIAELERVQTYLTHKLAAMQQKEAVVSAQQTR